MSKRGLSWLRQHTNVEDLLDDGIENNSDVGSFARSDDELDRRVDGVTEANGIGSTPPLPAHPVPDEHPRKPSYFGMFLGVLTIAAGSLLCFHPVNALVYHQRSRSYFSSWEFVSPERSEFYGVSGILIGLAILLLAAYRPRN
jgi:hypothetical protein